MRSYQAFWHRETICCDSARAAPLKRLPRGKPEWFFLAHSAVPFVTWRPVGPTLFFIPDYFYVPLMNCPLPSLYMAPGFFSSGPTSCSFHLSELSLVQVTVTVTYNTSIAHNMGKKLFSVLYICYLYWLAVPLGCRHYSYVHFTDDETEAQRI